MEKFRFHDENKIRYRKIITDPQQCILTILIHRKTLSLLREEKMARVDRNLARNGDRGPTRRLRWRISEASYLRCVKYFT
jgi:hypothetical protein